MKGWLGFALVGSIGWLLLPMHPAGADALPDWIEVAPALDRPHAVEGEAEFVTAERLEAWLDRGFGFVELSWRTRIDFAAEREVAVRQSIARVFVNSAGAQQGGNLQVRVETQRSKLRIDRAYLLLPGGKRQPVDPDSIQISDPTTPELFSDDKEVVLPLHGIVPGAVAFFEYVITRNLRDDPLPWHDTLNLKSSVPVLASEIVVASESGIEGIDWSTNDPGLECDEGVQLVCRRAEADPLLMDPAVRSYFDFVPHLAVGEKGSWATLSAAVAGLVDANADVSPEIQKEVERVRRQFDTPSERAAELYRVVANQVRYLGFEHGDSAVVPHKASQTWDRRFGDCKDKVTLFVAMARELGIDATPVLTSFTYFEPESAVLPIASYFDHMIVCTSALPRDGGCVDVTLANSPAELPFMLQGAMGLDLTVPGAKQVRRLPRREILWELGIDRTLRVGCDGQLHEEVELRRGGSWGDTMRSALAQIGPSERMQFVMGEYSQVASPNEVRPDLEIAGLGRVGQPWRVRHKATRAARVPIKGVQHFYDLDLWSSYFIRSLLSENQHYDYWFPGIHLRAVSRYDLCDETRVTYPGAELDLRAPWGVLTRSYEIDGNQVTVLSDLTMKARPIPPEELPDLRLFISRLLAHSAIQFGYSDAPTP